MIFAVDEGIYFESSRILFASYYILLRNIRKCIFTLLYWRSSVNQFSTSAKHNNKSMIYHCSILSESQIFLDKLRGFTHIQPKGRRRSKEANGYLKSILSSLTKFY